MRRDRRSIGQQPCFDLPYCDDQAKPRRRIGDELPDQCRRAGRIGVEVALYNPGREACGIHVTLKFVVETSFPSHVVDWPDCYVMSSGQNCQNSPVEKSLACYADSPVYVHTEPRSKIE